MMQKLAHHPVAVVVSICAVLSLAAASLVFIANEKFAPLTADQLTTTADEWRTAAVSGQLLVDQLNNEKVTRTFFTNQCYFLSDNAAHDQQALQSATPEDALQSQYQQLVSMSMQITTSLEQLCTAFPDQAQRQQIYLQLQTLADQL
jgi:hypothetical protein